MPMGPISTGESAILGVVQGLTEFLPVSSSGHLVIFQHFLGLHGAQLLFDVVLHFGTLLAVVLVYWRDLWKIFSQFFVALGGCLREGNLKGAWRRYPFFRLGIYLVAGTVPAAVAGLLLQDPLEKAFGSVRAASTMLIVTGCVLFFTRMKAAGGKKLEDLTLWHALVIGVFQALALCPGLSRSGMTIACALYIGLDRDLAARFSFLLMVPAVLGATILQLHGVLGNEASPQPLPFVLGGLVALGSGYLALKFLLGVVHRGRLYNFAYYCWALGTIVLIYSLVSG